MNTHLATPSTADSPILTALVAERSRAAAALAASDAASFQAEGPRFRAAGRVLVGGVVLAAAGFLLLGLGW
jgi:hypothetical protein